MKEGAIIHRFSGAIAFCEVGIHPRLKRCWLSGFSQARITGLCPAPFRLPCYGITRRYPIGKKVTRNSLSAFFHYDPAEEQTAVRRRRSRLSERRKALLRIRQQNKELSIQGGRGPGKKDPSPTERPAGIRRPANPLECRGKNRGTMERPTCPRHHNGATKRNPDRRV